MIHQDKDEHSNVLSASRTAGIMGRRRKKEEEEKEEEREKK